MKNIEIYLERVIEITNYSISPVEQRTHDYPGCPASIEDLMARWQDTGEPLTDKEFDMYCPRMEEAVWEANTYEPDYDRDSGYWGEDE
jgi:hypothetical protein